MRLPLLRLTLVLLALCFAGWLARGMALAAGMNSIAGTVTSKDNRPLADMVVLLQDEVGGLITLTTTDANGQYRFENLATGTYRVVAVDPPGTVDGDAVPGPHAAKIDNRTVQVTMVPGVAGYLANDFVKSLSQTPSPRIDPLLLLGDSIPVNRQLGFYNLNPLELDPVNSAIRRIADDGSLLVLDPAGTTLLRFPPPPGSLQILLDTTAQDPVDQVTLTRLLRVETSRSGISAVLALRADNTRGIYRLDDQRRLTRLALLPGATGPAELAISDGAQIAYVAPLMPTPSSPLALFQTVGDQPVELLQQDQSIPGSTATVQVFVDLTANDTGDLAFLTQLRRSDGSLVWAVLRKSSADLKVVAQFGQFVEEGRGAGAAGPLTGLDQPLIGPDGTVVFVGIVNSQFPNFFVVRPGRSPEPMLRWALWNPYPGWFDYDIAADGTVALRASLLPSSQSGLYLVAPTGDVSLIAGGQENVPPLPVGRPAFGPGGVLFFQAQDPGWPSDRNGRVPVGLFRYRPGGAQPAPVAVPGQAVPGLPGQQLLGVPQRPMVSADTVAFAGLFGGTDRFPVPTTGLFRLPLNGTLADGTLVGTQGAELSADATVIAFRDFYYTADGALVFDTFVRTGLAVGQLVATLAPRAATAGVIRPQAVPADTPTALLATGTDLGSGRKLQRLLGQVISLGADRKLFAADFSQSSGAGEGLFTIAPSMNNQIQTLAVTDGPASGPSLVGARFIGFGEIPKNGAATYTVYPPSVSVDGTVVFKARLEKSGVPTFGVFQWTGADPTAIAVTDPDKDNLALSAQDTPPYDLTRWAATKGHAYFLERHRTRYGAAVKRLFDSSAAGLRPLVDAGVPPGVRGSASTLADLSDLVVNHFGEVLINGATAAGPSILAVGPAGLMPLTPAVSKDQPIPRDADGRTTYPGLLFDGNFTLWPEESPDGFLAVLADVRTQGDARATKRGLFRRAPQGAVETVLLEGLDVLGSRDLGVSVAAAPHRQHNSSPGSLVSSQSQQEVGGAIAFAARSSDGRWAIYRSRPIRDPKTGSTSNSIVLVAKEEPRTPGGTHFVSLDPSILLGRPVDSGPVFRLNQAGDVAFLASHGQRWGIYRFSDTGP
jgi:carboxypeptidase family protein